MCTNIKKNHSSCDLPEEFEIQDSSFDSNGLYPALSHNSLYYEENQPYRDINEHHHEEHHKNLKNIWESPPVEIHEESTLNIDLPPISWHGYDTPPKILSVTNTGLTVLINGQWGRCRPYIQGGPLNGTYIFSQIHFHSPSEHEIDGRRYPLEMHVVHYKTCYLTQERAMEERDGTVVLVYLFQLVNTGPTILSSITNLEYLLQKENGRVELQGIFLNQILQPFSSNYYLYWGSISTSKNSFLLQWIISCYNLFVTQEEVDCLVKIMCSGGLLNEKHRPNMSPVNDVVYRVGEDNFDVIETPEWSTCQCRHICQSCNTCAVYKGECQLHLYSHAKESSSALKDFSKKDIKLQTSLLGNDSKIIIKPSICSILQKKKGKKKSADCLEASVTCICSSMSSESRSSCDGKKKKKKKEKDHKVQKVSSCPSVSKTMDVTCCDVESLKEKSLSCLLFKKSETNEPERTCDVTKKESKSGTESCTQQVQEASEVPKQSSKQKKKKSPSAKPERIKKKEKGKGKSPASSAGESSKQSVKEGKKGKKKKKEEASAQSVEVQAMSALECEKTFKLLSDFNFKCDVAGQGTEVTEPKEMVKFCNSEKLQPQEEEIEEKTQYSEPSNEIKTLFEKKRSMKNQEPITKNCSINFLLSPNIDPSAALFVPESEILRKSDNIDCESPKQDTVSSAAITAVISTVMSAATVSKSESLVTDSKQQEKELCLQTEIFFHSEKQGNFSACLSQDYNVAIIYNRNVLQEFKGTFKPSELELGSYEKLELLPTYPDAESISVRLEDCFVKMESVDGFYIRSKFLLSKIDFTQSSANEETGFSKNPAAPGNDSTKKDIDVEDDEIVISEREQQQPSDEFQKPGNSNESVFKNEALENQDVKIEMKTLDNDPERNDKSFTVNSLPQNSETIGKEEKKEKDLFETNGKKLNDLLYKRKKTVYFICEKIEKDENSGKKIFVGSFRTKDEIKALSKDRKVRMNPDPFFPVEKSLESRKEKKMFVLSNKESDFEKLISIESPMKQEAKYQRSASNKEMDNLDKSKDLIMLHSYKPKNSQANCCKGEEKHPEFQDQEVVLSPDEINELKENSEKSVDSSSLSCDKSSGKEKSQIALIIIPVEGEDLSKIEVILIEHLEKNEENNSGKPKKDNDEEGSEKPQNDNEEDSSEKAKKDVEKKNDGNQKDSAKKEEKEYIPCLNCYN